MAAFGPHLVPVEFTLALGLATARRERPGLVALRAQPDLFVPAARSSRVHVAMPGEWKGHRAGEFSLDATKFRQCVSTFEARVNATKFDYEHASLNPAATARGVPAAGWIQKLYVNAAGLFAVVDWTARAAEMIRSAEYKFCSSVFDFAATDRVTGDPIGTELVMVALTDSPFIDGLEPIALDD